MKFDEKIAETFRRMTKHRKDKKEARQKELQLVHFKIRYCYYSIWLMFLPPANQAWGKIIFSQAFVILFTGGGGLPDRNPLDRDPQTEAPQTAPPYGKEQAVSILLECRLVFGRASAKAGRDLCNLSCMCVCR